MSNSSGIYNDVDTNYVDQSKSGWKKVDLISPPLNSFLPKETVIYVNQPPAAHPDHGVDDDSDDDDDDGGGKLPPPPPAIKKTTPVDMSKSPFVLKASALA